MKFKVLDKEKINVFYGIDLNSKIKAIKQAYNIILGKVFIFTFEDYIVGNYLVVTNELFIIIINDKIVHKITYKTELQEIEHYNLDDLKEKKLYFIEILNPEDISFVSNFYFNFNIMNKE